MTPAEQLRINKRRKRPKRNPPAKSERVLWVNNLRKLREDHDLAMRDVAKAVGLSLAAYFRIENGYADPCLSNACKLAALYLKRVNEIWTQWKGSTP